MQFLPQIIVLFSLMSHQDFVLLSVHHKKSLRRNNETQNNTLSRTVSLDIVCKLSSFFNVQRGSSVGFFAPNGCSLRANRLYEYNWIGKEVWQETITQRARSLIIKTKGDLMIQVAFIILALVLLGRIRYIAPNNVAINTASPNQWLCKNALKQASRSRPRMSV